MIIKYIEQYEDFYFVKEHATWTWTGVYENDTDPPHFFIALFDKKEDAEAYLKWRSNP